MRARVLLLLLQVLSLTSSSCCPDLLRTGSFRAIANKWMQQLPVRQEGAWAVTAAFVLEQGGNHWGWCCRPAGVQSWGAGQEGNMTTQQHHAPGSWCVWHPDCAVFTFARGCL